MSCPGLTFCLVKGGINVFHGSWRGLRVTVVLGSFLMFLLTIRHVLSSHYHLVTIALCRQSPGFYAGFAGHTVPAGVATGSNVALELLLLSSHSA